MLINWEFADRIKEIDYEAEDYPNLITTLLSFSEKSKREGLLSLEDDISELKNNYLKLGFQLIIDDVDSNMVRSILETKIIVGNYRGNELLHRVICMEGILMIQASVHPITIKDKLMAFFPEDFLEAMRYYSD